MIVKNYRECICEGCENDIIRTYGVNIDFNNPNKLSTFATEYAIQKLSPMRLEELYNELIKSADLGAKTLDRIEDHVAHKISLKNILNRIENAIKLIDKVPK